MSFRVSDRVTRVRLWIIDSSIAHYAGCCLSVNTRSFATWYPYVVL